jgi:hypothetical protein
MRESYSEGLASHADPESCAGDREVVGEALTGAHAGWVWSSEIGILGCGRRGCRRNATRDGAQARVPSWPHGVEDPMHAWNLFVREPRDPVVACEMVAGGDQEAEEA